VKVAVLTEKGFALREQETPKCGPGDVLVKTLSCGICGGDVFAYTQALNAPPREVVLGHEGTGTVVAVGAGVEEFQEGDVVTALDGRYSDYFLTRHDKILKLPPGVDPLWAMGEPVACVLHAAPRFGINFGDRVALIGCGFMGLLCLQAALLRGAGHVCAMDPMPWRLEVACELGADETVSPEGASGADLAQRLGEFDVVIEAVGNQAALDLTWPLVRQHGRIIVIGYHQSGNGLRTVNMERWNFKAIDVINGHVRRDDEKLRAMQAGLDLMRAGRLRTAPLVTAYPLDRVNEAFADLAGRKEGLFKVALVP